MANQPPSDERIAGVRVRSLITIAAVLGACIIVGALLCSIPPAVSEFQPDPTPTIAPTWTPVPTFTPPPIPTATPKAIADLPIQQLHYDEYRFFHLLYEYTQCYRAYVQPPPTPRPTPTLGPTIEYAGSYPEEPWRDDPRFAHLQPTATPEPTAVPGAFPSRHRPPEYGLNEGDIEDHVLDDVSGATRWLIERYRYNDCEELTQYAVFPGRLTWLNERSAAQVAQ